MEECRCQFSSACTPAMPGEAACSTAPISITSTAAVITTTSTEIHKQNNLPVTKSIVKNPSRKAKFSTRGRVTTSTRSKVALMIKSFAREAGIG
ncbi:hypothetical protein E2C01_006367 [Portunus trituberculatus]|uniref:Uncharacterized protein n=1 Tax=Portunus trituberculatus TaxID=210409 RepID=A0A5B7CWQ2_PORTR|nr:hypothetical protein [Portunus trituberculatus]